MATALVQARGEKKNRVELLRSPVSLARNVGNLQTSVKPRRTEPLEQDGRSMQTDASSQPGI